MPRTTPTSAAPAPRDPLAAVKAVKTAKVDARVLNQQAFLAANPDWRACVWPGCTGTVSPDTYADGNYKYLVEVDGELQGECNRWATHKRIEEELTARKNHR